MRFVWDEWNITATYSRVDEKLIEACNRLSWRGNCALTIGIAEWIVTRFSKLDSDSDPRRFLEAAWIGIIDPVLVHQPVIDDDTWRGPVRGPMSMAMTFVADALFAEEAAQQANMNPVWAAAFARHVLPNTQAFGNWLNSGVDVLSAISPALDESEVDWFDVSLNRGGLVCPEMLDAAMRFGDPRTHLKVYMDSVTATGNPYIRLNQFPSA
ncbi:hypothetical protein IP84_12705 [beta proteobacterium AAP99]|nr:hypothetical protein IP84_12705 [beta proteobacterium AAP99]